MFCGMLSCAWLGVEVGIQVQPNCTLVNSNSTQVKATFGALDRIIYDEAGCIRVKITCWRIDICTSDFFNIYTPKKKVF